MTLSDLSWTVSTKDSQTELDWIKAEIERIGQGSLEKLAQTATEQSKHAYVPYSHYQVGVAKS